MTRSAQNSTAPAVVTSDAMVCEVLNGALGGYRMLRQWEASDPIAMLRQDAADVRVLVAFGSVPLRSDLIDALPNLGLVQVMSAGYDGVDPALLIERDIQLANVGEANSGVVADHALALALAARRHIINGDNWVRTGQWDNVGRYPLVRTISEEKAGILGLGHIGRSIARRLAGFGVETAWWGPRPKPDESLPRADSLLALAKASSLLFISCPGAPETEKLVDRNVIEAVGADGLIINVSRGSVVDEDALIDALRNGRLGGAALDVFEKEPAPVARWADVPNVVLSPHHAGVSFGALDEIRKRVRENVDRFHAGEPVLNRII